MPRLSPGRVLQGQAGFTLLETVLALFLFLLLVQSVLAVFWHAFLATERTQINAELQYAVRRARHHLGSDLARCSQVQVKDAAGQNADDGPHLYLTVNDEMVHYYLYNQQLYRDTSTASPLPLAEHLNTLSFSQSEPSRVVCLVGAAHGSAAIELVGNFKYGRYSTEVIQSSEE